MTLLIARVIQVLGNLNPTRYLLFLVLVSFLLPYGLAYSDNPYLDSAQLDGTAIELNLGNTNSDGIIFKTDVDLQIPHADPSNAVEVDNLGNSKTLEFEESIEPDTLSYVHDGIWFLIDNFVDWGLVDSFIAAFLGFDSSTITDLREAADELLWNSPQQ